MDQEVSQRQSVIELIQDSFDFLQAAGASCDVISGSSQDCITFVLPGFFIEVEIDWREQAVFTLLGELEAGKSRMAITRTALAKGVAGISLKL